MFLEKCPIRAQGLNTEKYGPEKSPYLDSFQAVLKFILKLI